MTRFSIVFVASFLLVSLTPRPADGQVRPPDPTAVATVQAGPLSLRPRFALRDVGVDGNVFNNAAEQSDFTATFGPGLDAWLQIRDIRLSSDTLFEWIYFQDTPQQRSFNIEQRGKVEWLLERFTLFGEGEYVDTRRRPNLEIDQRVRQIRTGTGVGVQLFLGPRTRVDLVRREATLDFGQSEFGDVELSRALNRSSATTAVDVRYGLTALTTLVTTVERTEDRFEVDRLRDTDSWRVMPGLEFRPFALISGSASLGYRRFETLATGVPDFAGVVVDVDLKYVIRDMTRFIVRAERDAEFSFESVEPFYVETGWDVDFTQAVSYNWDVGARYGRTQLAYRRVADATGFATGRVDRVTTYGVGIGRRFGTELRIGFDVNYGERRSDRATRNFDGYRVGGSVTYGY